MVGITAERAIVIGYLIHNLSPTGSSLWLLLVIIDFPLEKTIVETFPHDTLCIICTKAWAQTSVQPPLLQAFSAAIAVTLDSCYDALSKTFIHPSQIL